MDSAEIQVWYLQKTKGITVIARVVPRSAPRISLGLQDGCDLIPNHVCSEDQTTSQEAGKSSQTSIKRTGWEGACLWNPIFQHKFEEVVKLFSECLLNICYTGKKWKDKWTRKFGVSEIRRPRKGKTGHAGAGVVSYCLSEDGGGGAEGGKKDREVKQEDAGSQPTGGPSERMSVIN